MRRWVDRAGVLAAAAAALAVLGCQMAFVYKVMLDFDEAYNLQVPLNLYLNGRYQTWFDTPVLFPHQITTGPAVLLPIAGLFTLAGPGYLSARAVMTLFLAGYLGLANALCRRLAGRAGNWIFALAAILFLMVPSGLWMATVVLGEMPGVCFFLLGVWCMQRALDRDRRWLAGAAGAALALALLSKVVLLMLVVGVFLALPFSDELAGRRRAALGFGVCCAAGLATGMLSWEAVQLIGLGWPGYVDHYRQFLALMQFGGSGLTRNFLTTSPDFAAHVAVIAGALLRPPWQVWLSLALVGLATLAVVARRPRPFALLSLAGAVLVYWGWWLRVSTWLALRHLFAGYMAYSLLVPLVGGLLAADARLRWWLRGALLGGLGVAVAFTLPPHRPIPPWPWFNRLDLEQQEMCAMGVRFIRTLQPDSVFWGYGWRQAPEVSFLARVPFRDLTRHAPSADQHNYLLITRSSHTGARSTPLDYWDSHCEQTIYRYGWHGLCRLRPDAPQAVENMFHP